MIDLTGVRWRKSTRSTADGNCVEAAALGAAQWRKSTRSNDQANCVEVATNVPALVAVRDSKDPDGPALVVPPSDWRAFLDGVHDGAFEA